MSIKFKRMSEMFPGQERWGAVKGAFTFIITFDGEGYTASAKVICPMRRIFASRAFNRLDGSRGSKGRLSPARRKFAAIARAAATRERG